MQVAHCCQVHFDSGWGDFEAEVGDKEHKRFFSSWEDTIVVGEPAILETKVNKCVDSRTV